MTSKIRIISLLAILILVIFLLIRFGGYSNPARHISMDSQEFELAKDKANGGAIDSCLYVAHVLDYNALYSEAVNYWQCGINKNDVRKDEAMRYLASYNFHGKGMEANPAKGAMYLIISGNKTWPKNNEKSGYFWQGVHRYYDIKDIESIDHSFIRGLDLSSDFIKEHNIADGNINENYLNENFLSHIYSLQSSRAEFFIRSFIFFGLCFMMLYIFYGNIKSRKKKI